jgi:hypothetical protein
MYGEVEWLEEKHGKRSRRRWRKPWHAALHSYQIDHEPNGDHFRAAMHQRRAKTIDVLPDATWRIDRLTDKPDGLLSAYSGDPHHQVSRAAQ